MDIKDRAELVRAYRYEMKQRRSGSLRPIRQRADANAQSDAYYGDRMIDPGATNENQVPYHRTSRARADVRRNVERIRRVRRGESAQSYITRTNDTHGGGDISWALAARTHDLRRPQRARPARSWTGGYDYGYNNYDRGNAVPRAGRQNGRAPAYPGRNR